MQLLQKKNFGKRFNVMFASVLAIATVEVGRAATFNVIPDESPVEFLAVGKPGFLKIHGTGAKTTGTATLNGDKLDGNFKVHMADFVTGIDLRDKHMREKYLEVEKFPDAELSVAGVAIPPDNTEAAVEGKLKVKGVEKPVTIKLKPASHDAQTWKGEASFSMKTTDFPVGVPKYMGVTMAEDVDVKVQISAKVPAK